jgi:hypothetical protein
LPSLGQQQGSSPCHQAAVHCWQLHSKTHTISQAEEKLVSTVCVVRVLCMSTAVGLQVHNYRVMLWKQDKRHVLSRRAHMLAEG